MNDTGVDQEIPMARAKSDLAYEIDEMGKVAEKVCNKLEWKK